MALDPSLITPVILASHLLSGLQSLPGYLEMVTSYSVGGLVAQHDREAGSDRVKGVGFGIKSLLHHFLSLSLGFPICVITCLQTGGEMNRGMYVQRAGPSRA